jgi:hypothetical protein
MSRAMPTPERMRRGRLGRVLEALIPTGNPAAAIYGLLTIGALLAAETGLREKYIDTVGSALVALGLYWLAHAYSTMVGWAVSGRERLSPGALGRALRHDSSIVAGAGIPVVVLTVCWVVGADRETAVTVDVWTILVTLIVFELLAGLRWSRTLGDLVFSVGVAMTIGAGILVLRILLHH